jgi:hypothetical protein
VSLSYALMRFDSTIDPLPNVPALTNPCSSPGPQGGGGPPVLRSQVHPFLFQPPGNTGLAMSRSEREGRDSRVPFVAGRGPTGVPLPPPADTAGQTRHIFHPFPLPRDSEGARTAPNSFRDFFLGRWSQENGLFAENLVWSQENGSFARAEQCLNPPFHSMHVRFVPHRYTRPRRGY